MIKSHFNGLQHNATYCLYALCDRILINMDHEKNKASGKCVIQTEDKI